MSNTASKRVLSSDHELDNSDDSKPPDQKKRKKLSNHKSIKRVIKRRRKGIYAKFKTDTFDYLTQLNQYSHFIFNDNDKYEWLAVYNYVCDYNNFHCNERTTSSANRCDRCSSVSSNKLFDKLFTLWKTDTGQTAIKFYEQYYVNFHGFLSIKVDF